MQDLNSNSNNPQPPLNLLSSPRSGDLQKIKGASFFTRSRLLTMLVLGLLLGTPLTLPTFANYLESLNANTSNTKSELVTEDDEQEGKEEKNYQPLLWGLLLLTVVGGVATFKSLHKMEGMEESEEFFINKWAGYPHL